MKMKKTVSALLLASAGWLAAMPAMAQEMLDFTLVNKTGYTISEVYVSSAAADTWEEDIMGRDLLENGERVDIAFGKGAKGCKWDMKVTYDDGEEAIWQGFDLCTISSIVLRYDRKKDQTWADIE